MTHAQRALLDAIAAPESAGRYDRRYTPEGGATFTDFSRHPQIYEANITPGLKPSSAAGRYQMVYSTWAPIAASLGLTDFSPEAQDAAAWQNAVETYARETQGRDLLSDLNTGDPTILGNVAPTLSGQWSSLAGGIQAQRDTFATDFLNSMDYYAAADQASDPIAANHIPGMSADQLDRLQEREADIAARDSTLGDTVRGFLGAPVTFAMRAAEALRSSLTPSDAPVAGETAARAGAGPGAPGEAMGGGTVGAVERGPDLPSPTGLGPTYNPGPVSAVDADPMSLAGASAAGEMAPTTSDFGVRDFGGLGPAIDASGYAGVPSATTAPTLGQDRIGVDTSGQRTAAQRMYAGLGIGPPDATGPVAAAAAAPPPSTAAAKMYSDLGLSPPSAPSSPAPAERAIDRVTSALGLSPSIPSAMSSVGDLASASTSDPRNFGPPTAPTLTDQVNATLSAPTAPVGPAPGTVGPGKPGEPGSPAPATPQSPLSSLAPAALAGLAGPLGPAALAYGLGKAATGLGTLGSLTAPPEATAPAPEAAPAAPPAAPAAPAAPKPAKPGGLPQAPEMDTPFGAPATPQPEQPGVLGTIGDVGKGMLKGATLGGLVGGLPGTIGGGLIGGFLGLGGDRINSLFGGPQPMANAPAATFADLVPNAAPGLLNAVNMNGYGPAPAGFSYGFSPFGLGVGLVSNNAPLGIQIAGSGPGLLGALGFGSNGYGPTRGTGPGSFGSVKGDHGSVTEGTGGLY